MLHATALEFNALTSKYIAFLSELSSTLTHWQVLTIMNEPSLSFGLWGRQCMDFVLQRESLFELWNCETHVPSKFSEVNVSQSNWYFFSAETYIETLHRRFCWGKKDVSSPRNLINRVNLHERLVYNSRCFQETSSSFPCFQQVHYFALFCSVFSEVVRKSSLHIKVLLISPGQARGSLLRNRSLACHETPPKGERDMQWHPKNACEGDWEGVILRLEMKSTAELAAFRGVPLYRSISGKWDMLARYTQIFGNFSFCAIWFSFQNFQLNGSLFENSTIFILSINFPREFP